MPWFKLRKKKTKKEAEEKIIEEEKIRAAEERRLYERILALRTEYRILDNYPLYDPWARALILERKSDGSILYYVDEIPLTKEEKDIYKRIMEILYWELEPAPPGVDPIEHFRNQATSIIKRFALRFQSTIHPGISWGKVEYYILRDTIEYDVLTPLMKDPAIEDISCDGVGRPVYVWHIRYESIPTNIKFNREEDLDALIVKLAHKAGKHVSVAFPIVDAILPEGHRLAATYKKEVSKYGSTFTIRKFREKPLSIVDLIRGGTVSTLLAAYFWKLMEYNLTGLIMGVTGAGKTTLLNAIATLLRPTIKIVTIEDTPELRLTHENWVQLYSRPSYGFEAGLAEISLYDLIRISLRYRPDVLIVGEVRGEEAKVLFQAIASVTWDTPVLVRNRNTGEVKLVPIGEFVDSFYPENIERIAIDVDGWEVLSHEEYKAQWKPIKYVLRHSAEDVYVIEAEGGLKLGATGNHSVFILDEETLKITEKKVEELKPGDLLLSFTQDLHNNNQSIGVEKEARDTSMIAIDNTAKTGNETITLYKSNSKSTITSNVIKIQEEDIELINNSRNDSLLLKLFSNTIRVVERVRGGIHVALDNEEVAKQIVWMARTMGYPSHIIYEESKDNEVTFNRYVVKICTTEECDDRIVNKIPAKALIKLAELAGVKVLPGEFASIAERRLISIDTTKRFLEWIKGPGSLKGEAGELFDRITRYMKGSIHPLKILGIKKVKNPWRYVYDISVPDTESFFGGNIPVLLHNTGHGGITTIHAETIDAAIKRLTSPPMDIPPGYIPLVNFGMVIKRVRIPTGTGTHRIARRVTDVWEIRDYEDYIKIARWDPATREHEVYLDESILIPRIAEMTGVEVSEVIEDIRRREMVLRWMALRGMTKYEEVASKIMEYYRRPNKLYNEAVKEVERLERYT